MSHKQRFQRDLWELKVVKALDESGENAVNDF